MHWYDLPKVTHNEESIREYEQAESRRLGRWIKRTAFVLIPLALLIAWFLIRQR